MNDHATVLRARAKRRYAELARARQDPRYRRVLGRFRAARLLETNYDVPDYRRPIAIGDALWTGKFEPRVLELLPALIVKKPSLFETLAELPKDLADVVTKLRRNENPGAFRGIPGPDLAKWVPRVGHRGKTPSRLKCFRFSDEDLKLLEELSRARGLSETATIRLALRSLARFAPAR
jgi:hypothetical protein